MDSLQSLKNKILSNIRIYRIEYRKRGLGYVISARLKKFKVTRFVYYLFTPSIIRTKHGLTMMIDKKDTVVSETLLQNGEWEPFTTSTFLDYLSESDIVIDLGAHIGYYTLLAAERVGITGKVYAFEPDPRNFSLLKKNVSVNDFPQVVTENLAVGAENGTVKLYREEHNLGDHRIYASDGKRHALEVNITKLDAYFSSTLPSVALLKMDIQGAEYQALLGMRSLIKKNKNMVIITEFWPEGMRAAGSDPEAFLKELQSLGYTFQIIDEEKKRVKKVTIPSLLHRIADKTLYDANLLCLRAS